MVPHDSDGELAHGPVWHNALRMIVGCVPDRMHEHARFWRLAAQPAGEAMRIGPADLLLFFLNERGGRGVVQAGELARLGDDGECVHATISNHLGDGAHSGPVFAFGLGANYGSHNISLAFAVNGRGGDRHREGGGSDGCE